jgi:hypothetical protein
VTPTGSGLVKHSTGPSLISSCATALLTGPCRPASNSLVRISASTGSTSGSPDQARNHPDLRGHQPDPASPHQTGRGRVLSPDHASHASRLKLVPCFVVGV